MSEGLSKIPAEPILPPEDLELEALWELEKAQAGQDLLALEYRQKLSAVEIREHELVVERSMLRQRQIYAFLLFALISIWLCFIGVVVFMAGSLQHPTSRFHFWPLKINFPASSFKLSDSVLIALISTSTANVLGLFYIVARWLFPNKYSTPDEKKSEVEKPKVA